MSYKNFTQDVSDSLMHIKLNELNTTSLANKNSLSSLDLNLKALLNQVSNQKVILKSDIKRLNIPTYDGSGHACHPAVVYTPYKFKGYKYWMAFTPYPSGNAQYEDPSILVSNDGISWSVPSGLTNPITRAPAGGYNSDTDLLHNPKTGQLICYYRPVVNGQSIIVRKTSTDGINWSAEETCPGTENVLSPQIVMTDVSSYLMVGQKGGDFIALTSTDGINFTQKEKSKMNIPDMLWHIGMCKTTTGYLFTLCTFNAVGSNANTNLYFGSSRNGLTPTLISDTPIVYPKEFYDLQVYQSVLVPCETGMRLYVSGQQSSGAWTMGYADVILAEPLYSNDGILNKSVEILTVESTKSTNVLQYERTYNAKEIRIIVNPDANHSYDVKLLQDSSGNLSKVLSKEEGYGGSGGIYKDQLYSNKYTVNITNKDTANHTYTVTILLVK